MRFPRMMFACIVASSLFAAVGSTRSATAQGFQEFTISDPTFTTGPETDFWVASAAPADFDADGDLDLLVSGYYVIYNESVEERLLVFRNDGAVDATTWGFTAVPLELGGLVFHDGDLAWGDYDNDGDPDVLVAASGECALYRNDAGSMHLTSTLLPPYWEEADGVSFDQSSIAWGDYDNDGDLDLVLPATYADFEYQPTKILRNDGPAAGDAWTFTDTGADLPIAPNAISSWADMDGDGDLDLMHAHVQPDQGFLNTYRNDGGTLVLQDDTLAQIRYGMADWGDADNDGDLDIVYAGNIDRPDGFGETVVRILRNDGAGGYVPEDIVQEFQGPEEPWLGFNGVSWADYDSDGDIDLLIAGEWLGDGEIFGRSMVYQNDGGGFSSSNQPLPAPLDGQAGGAFTWFDVDGDGDLDYFVAGGYYVPDGNGLIEARTQLFRNEAAGTNAAPSAPSSLSSTRIGLNGVRLAWNASNDDHTPSNRLTYHLELTRAGSLAPQERALPVPGAIRGRTNWTLRGLRPGAYRWTVRAIDSADNGSVESQGTFTLGTTDVAPSAPAALSFVSMRNPLRSHDLITFALDHRSEVDVSIFDPTGRRRGSVATGAWEAGVHEVSLSPAHLASGTYFIRAVADGRAVSRRLTIIE